MSKKEEINNLLDEAILELLRFGLENCWIFENFIALTAFALSIDPRMVHFVLMVFSTYLFRLALEMLFKKINFKEAFDFEVPSSTRYHYMGSISRRYSTTF
jgi:hypothetical protein